MGRDYFSILFNRVRFRTVSYLTPEESAEILEKPARESLEYDPAVLADAYRLIRGQPLLLQMLGAALIEQFKEQVRRGDGRSNEVDINDFTAIIERLVQAGSNAAFETLLLRGEKFGLNFYMGRYWYRRCTMKFVKHALIAAGIAAALMVIPSLGCSI